jgi:hypothetical protein
MDEPINTGRFKPRPRMTAREEVGVVHQAMELPRVRAGGVQEQQVAAAA